MTLFPDERRSGVSAREDVDMTIGYPGLFMIVFASAFIGCCVGVVVMAMCKVSAANNYSEEENP